MAIKRFNNATKKLEPININVQQEYTNPSTGLKNITNRTFDNFNDSINMKLNKLGDSIKGLLELDGENAGIQAVNVNNGVYTSSKINNDNGYLKVSNIEKDISDFDNILEIDNSYFNLKCDSEPTQDSNNLITSGTLYTILQDIYQRLPSNN